MFTAYLADDPEFAAENARQIITVIQRTLLDGIPDAGGQAHRVAHRFAPIAAAGEMARVALDLPWAEGEVERAAAICFDAWRSSLGGEGPGELVAAPEAIKAAVEKHGESRFRKVHDEGAVAVDQAPIRDLLGYRHPREGELLWGFTSTGWKEVLAGIAETKGIACLLAERDAIVCSRNDGVTGVTDVAGSGQACPDVDERQAIAEIEGGVPAVYAHAFAALQLTPPSGLAVTRWLQTVDDAGRFLDRFGRTAKALGWSATDLFSPEGLIRALNGTSVSVLTSDTAQLADGRVFSKSASSNERGLRHG